MIKVSVIVPVYNAEDFIEECIDSILNQSLREIEVICVDDGSQDASSAILDYYADKDKRLRVIHKKNSGYGHSVNIGIDIATGEYIGIVESDDFISFDMYENLYKAATENKADVVKANYYEYTNGNKQFKEVLDRCYYDYIFTPTQKVDIFYTPASIWSGIYKRDFLERNEIRLHESPGASYQDTSFIFKVWTYAERVYLIKNAYLYYRIDNPNSSVKSPLKIFCINDEFKEIDSFIENHFDNQIHLKAIEMVIKYLKYRWNYNRLSVSFQYAFLLEFVKEFKISEEMGYLIKAYWEDNLWNDVHEILRNPNLFYEATCKDDYDSRLEEYTTRNMDVFKKCIIQYILDYQYIIIYGAGKIGRKVLLMIENYRDVINNICFAVTCKEMNPSTIDGYNVYSIDELNVKYKSQGLVIVAVRERDQFEIVTALKKHGFGNVLLVDLLFRNLFME